jgi:hypothetical protein
MQCLALGTVGGDDAEEVRAEVIAVTGRTKSFITRA